MSLMLDIAPSTFDVRRWTFGLERNSPAREIGQWLGRPTSTPTGLLTIVRHGGLAALADYPQTSGSAITRTCWAWEKTLLPPALAWGEATCSGHTRRPSRRGLCLPGAASGFSPRHHHRRVGGHVYDRCRSALRPPPSDLRPPTSAALDQQRCQQMVETNFASCLAFRGNPSIFCSRSASGSRRRQRKGGDSG